MIAKASALPAGGHAITLRVYYEDTDAGGFVYYANYLKFAERARTEALYALGWDQSELAACHDIILVVRRCEVDYLAPARLGDIVEIRSVVAHTGGARFTMDQAIVRDGRDLVRMVVLLACVGANGKPKRLPAPLRSALSGPSGPVGAI